MVGVSQRVDDVVAFGVGVRVDPVGDLPGEARQADGAVVGSRREEVDALAAGKAPPFGRGPEAHVVALRGVTVHFLLIGEGLPPAEEEEVGDGGVRVGAAQQRGFHDPPGGTQGHVVGEGPARRLHGRVDVLGRAVEGEVDGVAEDAVARAGPPDEIVGDVEDCEQLVDPGQRQVGDEPPEDDEVGAPGGVPRASPHEDLACEPQDEGEGHDDENRGDRVPDGGPAAPADLPGRTRREPGTARTGCAPRPGRAVGRRRRPGVATRVLRLRSAPPRSRRPCPHCRIAGAFAVR